MMMLGNSIYCFLLLINSVRLEGEIEVEHDCSSSPPLFPVTMNDCCNQHLENDPYFYQQCYLSVTSKLGSNSQLRGAGSSGGPAGCVAECVTLKLDVLKDGKLNETLINNLKLIDESNVFYQVHKDARKFCVAEANSRADAFLEIQNGFDVIPGQRNCNPISGFFYSCLHNYVFRHCPIWQDHPGCNEMKSFYNACPLNHF